MTFNSLEVISFVAYDVIIDEHHFQCYKVIVSFDGIYTCTINGDTMPPALGYVLDRNVGYACNNQKTSLIVYLIEIESRVGRAVRELLDNKPYQDISALLAVPAFKQLLATGHQAFQDQALPAFVDSAIKRLFPNLPAQPLPYLDNRIPLIISYIDAHLDRTISLVEVANFINLSEGRTRFIINREFSTPFTQYVLWKRVKAVIGAVIQEHMNLGQAAYQFGFADQPHFNRVFKRMFGITPYRLLKNKRIIWILNTT